MSLSAMKLAARISTGLGIASWSRWLIAMGVAMAVAGSAMFWAGQRWERGAQAMSKTKEQARELKTREAEIADLRSAARDIKQAGIDASAQWRQSAYRQGEITDGWIAYSNQTRRLFKAHTDQLGDLLAGMPACDGGERVRDYWNRASRLASPEHAAAGPAVTGERKPADAVRGDAAGTRRTLRNADPRPRRGDGSGPAVRGQTGGIERSRARAAGQRVAVVLPGGRRGWIHRSGVSAA